jgi:ankyrin repeat protein
MNNELDNNLRKKNLKDLFVLFGSILAGRTEILNQMLSEGANINSRLNDISLDGLIELDSKEATILSLDTPMLIALKHNSDFEIIKILFENGADVTLKNNNGKSSIDIAKEKGMTEVLKLFKVENS